MSVGLARLGVNFAIVAAALAVAASIAVQSGRTEQNRGLGYDGKIYGAMMVEGLDAGGPNTRMRPLVILTNQFAYDFLFKEPIRTFQAMNVLYAALLTLVLCGILDAYGVTAAHKLVFIVNVFATIAVTKMFAFYPVLVDLGAYMWVSLAVLAILAWRRSAIVATTLAAVFAREFGLVAVLFGIHRDLRRGVSKLAIAATYGPAIVAFALLRQWVRATTETPASAPGIQGGLLSGSDVIANLAYLVNPVFLVMLAYFTATVFGGISLLLLVRAFRGRLRFGGETEWLTYLAVTAVLTVAGNADMWRYLAYALPAVAALYAKNLALDDWRFVAPWAALVTIFSQQPWLTMDDRSYFREWFPMYLPIFGVPDPPTYEFWMAWAIRIAVVACLAVAAWVAYRPGGIPAGAPHDVPPTVAA
jgi:hypothetical protein